MPFYPTIPDAEADGLIHYWPMSEQSGATVADIIGGWNGRLVGVNDTPTSSEIADSIVAAPSESGRDLGARYVDDTTELMPIELTPPAPSLAPLSAITVRIRFYLTSEEFGSLSSWSPFGLGVTDGAVYLAQNNGSFGLEYRYGTRTDNLSNTNPFLVGEWNDLIISASGAGAIIYANGQAIFSTTTFGSTFFDIYRSNGSAVVGWIGARNFGFGTPGESYSRANIIVDDFAIWNRALSLAEMDALYAAGPAEELTPPPPVNVTFDVQTSFSASFVAYSTNYSGFVASVGLSASFEVFQDWVKSLSTLQLQEVYQLVITGAADGLDDIVVPISNWQATNQAGDRSAYLQAVIPGADEYIDAISARPSGYLILKQGYLFESGESQLSEILRSDFDTLRYDRSGNRFTATVSGRRFNESASSGLRILKGIRTISVADGKRRVRCDVDLFLRPGMTVIAGAEEFTADYINYFVTTNDRFCEVSER